MVKKARQLVAMTGTRDVACVIHGSVYDWCYVERLYNMVVRHSTEPVRFHVFTEHDRSVPLHMIKHALTDWPGVIGAKKSWWYKMQMFDARHLQGRVLYLDLDTVIVRNIDWIWQHEAKYFWTVRDFRHLWRPQWQGINSSLMFWDTLRFDWIWKQFTENNIATVIKQYHGDQDYLNAVISRRDLRFFDIQNIKSWRWQIKDGGLDMKSREYRQPGVGSVLDPESSILVFHGKPKPHEITDQLILKNWY